jgi:hypothetical protein
MAHFSAFYGTLAADIRSGLIIKLKMGNIVTGADKSSRHVRQAVKDWLTFSS